MLNNIGLPGLFIVLILIFAQAVPAVMIARKAGFGKGWMGLLYIIPFVNILLVWIFAFIDWPCHKKGAE